MEITDVRVALRDDEKLKGFITVTFDSCFVIRGIKVIEGRKGLFVAMPTRQSADGSFEDVAHPIHADMRERLESRVLAEYQSSRDGVEASLR
ncbi:MAG: septation protein spoVG [Gemmatimonadetes bacterium]|nr:septation protein spoVG [Gemmatimonadota bacterium]